MSNSLMTATAHGDVGVAALSARPPARGEPPIPRNSLAAKSNTTRTSLVPRGRLSEVNTTTTTTTALLPHLSAAPARSTTQPAQDNQNNAMKAGQVSVNAAHAARTKAQAMHQLVTTSTDPYSAFEAALLAEVNLLRRDPKAYAVCFEREATLGYPYLRPEDVYFVSDEATEVPLAGVGQCQAAETPLTTVAESNTTTTTAAATTPSARRRTVSEANTTSSTGNTGRTTNGAHGSPNGSDEAHPVPRTTRSNAAAAQNNTNSNSNTTPSTNTTGLNSPQNAHLSPVSNTSNNNAAAMREMPGVEEENYRLWLAQRPTLQSQGVEEMNLEQLCTYLSRLQRHRAGLERCLAALQQRWQRAEQALHESWTTRDDRQQRKVKKGGGVMTAMSMMNNNNNNNVGGNGGLNVSSMSNTAAARSKNSLSQQTNEELLQARRAAAERLRSAYQERCTAVQDALQEARKTCRRVLMGANVMLDCLRALRAAEPAPPLRGSRGLTLAVRYAGQRYHGDEERFRELRSLHENVLATIAQQAEDIAEDKTNNTNNGNGFAEGTQTQTGAVSAAQPTGETTKATAVAADSPHSPRPRSCTFAPRLRHEVEHLVDTVREGCMQYGYVSGEVRGVQLYGRGSPRSLVMKMLTGVTVPVLSFYEKQSVVHHALPPLTTTTTNTVKVPATMQSDVSQHGHAHGTPKSTSQLHGNRKNSTSHHSNNMPTGQSCDELFARSIFYDVDDESEQQQQQLVPTARDYIAATGMFLRGEYHPATDMAARIYRAATTISTQMLRSNNGGYAGANGFTHTTANNATATKTLDRAAMSSALQRLGPLLWHDAHLLGCCWQRVQGQKRIPHLTASVANAVLAQHPMSLEAAQDNALVHTIIVLASGYEELEMIEKRQNLSLDEVRRIVQQQNTSSPSTHAGAALTKMSVQDNAMKSEGQTDTRRSAPLPFAVANGTDSLLSLSTMNNNNNTADITMNNNSNAAPMRDRVRRAAVVDLHSSLQVCLVYPTSHPLYVTPRQEMAWVALRADPARVELLASITALSQSTPPFPQLQPREVLVQRSASALDVVLVLVDLRVARARLRSAHEALLIHFYERARDATTTTTVTQDATTPTTTTTTPADAEGKDNNGVTTTTTAAAALLETNASHALHAGVQSDLPAQAGFTHIGFLRLLVLESEAEVSSSTTLHQPQLPSLLPRTSSPSLPNTGMRMSLAYSGVTSGNGLDMMSQPRLSGTARRGPAHNLRTEMNNTTISNATQLQGQSMKNTLVAGEGVHPLLADLDFASRLSGPVQHVGPQRWGTTTTSSNMLMLSANPMLSESSCGDGTHKDDAMRSRGWPTVSCDFHERRATLLGPLCATLRPGQSNIRVAIQLPRCADYMQPQYEALRRLVDTLQSAETAEEVKMAAALAHEQQKQQQQQSQQQQDVPEERTAPLFTITNVLHHRSSSNSSSVNSPLLVSGGAAGRNSPPLGFAARSAQETTSPEMTPTRCPNEKHSSEENVFTAQPRASPPLPSPASATIAQRPNTPPLHLPPPAQTLMMQSCNTNANLPDTVRAGVSVTLCDIECDRDGERRGRSGAYETMQTGGNAAASSSFIARGGSWGNVVNYNNSSTNNNNAMMSYNASLLARDGSTTNAFYGATGGPSMFTSGQPPFSATSTGNGAPPFMLRRRQSSMYSGSIRFGSSTNMRQRSRVNTLLGVQQERDRRTALLSLPASATSNVHAQAEPAHMSQLALPQLRQLGERLARDAQDGRHRYQYALLLLENDLQNFALEATRRKGKELQRLRAEEETLRNQLQEMQTRVVALEQAAMKVKAEVARRAREQSLRRLRLTRLRAELQTMQRRLSTTPLVQLWFCGPGEMWSEAGLFYHAAEGTPCAIPNTGVLSSDDHDLDGYDGDMSNEVFTHQYHDVGCIRHTGSAVREEDYVILLDRTTNNNSNVCEQGSRQGALTGKAPGDYESEEGVAQEQRAWRDETAVIATAQQGGGRGQYGSIGGLNDTRANVITLRAEDAAKTRFSAVFTVPENFTGRAVLLVDGHECVSWTVCDV